MDEDELHEFAEDVRYRLLGGKDAAYFGAEAMMARHLRMWPIRFVIGVIVFGAIAWKWAWGKWLLIAWIAIMGFALWYIFHCRRKVREKFDLVESKLNKPWTVEEE